MSEPRGDHSNEATHWAAGGRKEAKTRRDRRGYRICWKSTPRGWRQRVLAMLAEQVRGPEGKYLVKRLRVQNRQGDRVNRSVDGSQNTTRLCTPRRRRWRRVVVKTTCTTEGMR